MVGQNTARRDKEHIHSVERALTVLEVLGGSPHPLTLTEVANHVRLTKTTTQRLINTLAALGYVNREENKKYFLGTKVLSLGFQFLNSSSLVQVSRPYLDELSSELGMTVNLAVLDGRDILILYRREVRKFFQFDVHAGSKLLAYGSALGRVLLASLSDGEIEPVLDAMEIQKITPKTVVAREEIVAHVLDTRRLGYAISDQEQTMDLCSIAVPLLDEKRRTAAAINVSIDAHRRADPAVLARTEAALFAKGRLISMHLGYTGEYPKIFATPSEDNGGGSP